MVGAKSDYDGSHPLSGEPSPGYTAPPQGLPQSQIDAYLKNAPTVAEKVATPSGLERKVDLPAKETDKE